MSEIIKLENISFSYKKKIIYADFNLSINKGDVLAILGHNGAGKTTLIKIIAGLLKIKYGSIERNVDFSKIALMNEELGFYPFLNAKQNLDLLMLRHDKTIENIDYNLLFDQYGLNNDDVVEKFSTGMKKKLSLMGVLLQNPELYLLDEPFSGIDPVSLKFIITKIKENSNSENAFVIVNHDLPSTIKLCNKFVIIKNGKLAFYSDKKEDINNLEEIYSKYSE